MHHLVCIFTHILNMWTSSSRRRRREQVEEAMLILYRPVLLVGLLLALGQVCKSYWMVHYGRIYRFIHNIMHRRQHNIHGSRSQQHESRVWTDSEDGQLRKFLCYNSFAAATAVFLLFYLLLLSAIIITQSLQYIDRIKMKYMAQGCNLFIILTCMKNLGTISNHV